MENDTTLCWRCGKEIPYNSIETRAYCPECQLLAQQESEELTQNYLKYKSLIMYENALKGMEKQKLNMHYYYEACQVLKERIISDYKTFESADEIMACIELLNNEIEVKPQYRIGKYTVDFMLPKLKIILEIDGYLHNNSKVLLRDAKRDVEILNELGSGWEVIRVKTSVIEKRLMFLVDDIIKEYKMRQQLRKCNHGILPDNYNDYTKVLYKDILGLYKYEDGYLTDTDKREMKDYNELKFYKGNKQTNNYYQIKNFIEKKKKELNKSS